MPIAKEGLREIALATLVLGLLAWGGAWVYWPLAIPFALVWVWVLSFFRDPTRRGTFQPGDLCSPADGTVTEITHWDDYEPLGGPAIRIGMFLSLLNVHVNRSPCSGTVRSLSYRAGEYLDARHSESGRRNESNALLIDPDGAVPGPVEVRQVAGFLARRIICHARVNQHLTIGSRFGLIKFGSRTELVIPQCDDTEILVKVGDKVRGGLTVMARQPLGEARLPGPTGKSVPQVESVPQRRSRSEGVRSLP
jgi:phosphatidylserine decarboxylase